MLNGVGQVQGGVYTFGWRAPAGVGIPLAVGQESTTSHSAYRDGMSQWCANCHGAAYHGAGSGSAFQHDSNRALGGTVSAQYNRFAGDLNPIGGSQTTAYLPEVPFEDPTSAPDSTVGPTASSRIMCLSCHRAHASSSPAAGRWDFNVQALGEDGQISGSYAIPNPYGDPGQSPLCSKCHEAGSTDGGLVSPQPSFP
jgi:hypothetical protein